MTARPRPLPIRQLADDQADVVTREQLYATGLTPGEVNAQVTARRWQQVNEAVVVLHNGPLTRAQQEWAVLLSAPAPSALCALTAARHAGLRGYDDSLVHVVVQRGAKVLDLTGIPVRVHESRRFTAEDVWTFHQLRRTGNARSLLDAAVWSRLPADAARLTTAGVQQRLVTPAELSDELERAGRVRHRRMLRLLLNDLHGRAQALSEVEFLRFCRRHGLPEPRMNVRTDVRGRRRYLDAELVGRDGRVVRVEVDGGVHLSLTQRWLDTARDNDLYLAQRHGLRFPSVAIYTDDPRAVRQLREALDLSDAG